MAGRPTVRTRRSFPELCETEDSEYAGLASKKKLHKSSVLASEVQPASPYSQIEECPTYTLTLEDMQGDPSSLIDSLTDKYVEFGAVKLVACDQWNPPLTFRYIDKGITTRVQVLQDLAEGKVYQFRWAGRMEVGVQHPTSRPSRQCFMRAVNLAL